MEHTTQHNTTQSNPIQPNTKHTKQNTKHNPKEGKGKGSVYVNVVGMWSDDKGFTFATDVELSWQRVKEQSTLMHTLLKAALWSHISLSSTIF